MRRQILIALVAVIAVVGIVLGWYFITQRQVGRLIAQGERTNILLLGLDQSENTSRSDTIILLSLAPEEEVVLLSLPRDLRAKFPDGEFHKLNAAYPLGGARLACKTVSALLGIEVPFYVTLDYTGFERLIDLLGGITLTVEERMVYTDERADPPLHIDIYPGTQTMDGKTALHYIRYRDETGDIGRIARHQKLIAAILEKGFHHQEEPAIREIIKAIHPYLSTNLSLIDLFDLSKLVRRLRFDQMQMATIPTEPVTIDGVSYLEMRVVATARIIAQTIKGIDLLTPDEISIAIYNGSGAMMLAARTAEHLRKRDFRITKTANADSFGYTKTQIVILSEEAKAWVLQRALPSEATVVSLEDFTPLYGALATPPAGTDLLLIVGANFEVTR